MPDSLIGRTVNGRYEITEKLGSGGLGAVYKAKDLVLDREVAIKAIQPDSLVTASSAMDMFLQEAKIIARLDHPNILAIYDVVRQNDPDYPILMVTRLARGGSLSKRLEATGGATRTLSPGETAPILTQVAAALDYAHSQRVIHLDIKPQNILFADAADQMALVADFGLARLLQTTTHVPVPGGVGTWAYMPPEQLQGGDAGRYSDVYALGITLYKMLTGEVPKRSPNDSMYAVQLNRPLPEKIRQVIERATLPDARRRYPSAGELARAFKIALHGSSALPPPAAPARPPSSQPVPVPDSSPTWLQLPTKPLTDREQFRVVLRDLEVYSERNPNVTEQELIAYAFRPHGLFATLGYDTHDKNIFVEHYHTGIVLLMVTGRPLAVVEFKRPVFSITDGLEQLERQYIARLRPDSGVLCNGRELWIYRRTGDFLFHPPALRLVLSQASEYDAEAIYNWLGRREDAPAPASNKPPSSPNLGGYPGAVQRSGPMAGGSVYPNPLMGSASPSPHPYAPPYSPYPPSGPIWSPLPVVKRTSLKAIISFWLGILTFLVGIVVASQFYALKEQGLIGEIISEIIAVWLGVITVVLGHLAKREIRQSNKQMKGTIRAILGLIFGYLNIALFLIALLEALFPSASK